MSIQMKPKLTAEDQVRHLVSKGVKFTLMSQEDAVKYLSENNNYFKLTAYRKTFGKYREGPLAGQYLDLEFWQLKDLAIIDMRLRYVLLEMALDIEHFAKVRLIKRVELATVENGYSIVEDYISSLNANQQKGLDIEMERNRKSHYCKAIVAKYTGGFPVWAFVEIIPFGQLVSFYRFSAERFNDTSLQSQFYLLLPTKAIRNAVAHNNCILNDLTPNTVDYPTHNAVSIALGKIKGLGGTSRSKKMSNARIQQIVTLLYTHKELVTSSGVRENRSKSLRELTERMFLNASSYKSNTQITSSFVFLKKIIDSWFPVV